MSHPPRQVSRRLSPVEIHRDDAHDLQQVLDRAHSDPWVEDVIIDSGSGTLTLGVDPALAGLPGAQAAWQRRAARIRRS